jgi:predicted ATPase
MERAAGLAHDDTPQARLDKLAAMLAQNSSLVQDAALFAVMLSLPNARARAEPGAAPVRSLVLQVVAFARQNPVLMIFEGSHWTDPTSLELFGRVVNRFGLFASANRDVPAGI